LGVGTLISVLNIGLHSVSVRFLRSYFSGSNKRDTMQVSTSTRSLGVEMLSVVRMSDQTTMPLLSASKILPFTLDLNFALNTSLGIETSPDTSISAHSSWKPQGITSFRMPMTSNC